MALDVEQVPIWRVSRWATRPRRMPARAFVHEAQAAGYCEFPATRGGAARDEMRHARLVAIRRAVRPCQRHRREESVMYIGLGTVVVIVIIVLAIMLLRRA
jgi:hypothetical protein